MRLRVFINCCFFVCKKIFFHGCTMYNFKSKTLKQPTIILLVRIAFFIPSLGLHSSLILSHGGLTSSHPLLHPLSDSLLLLPHDKGKRPSASTSPPPARARGGGTPTEAHMAAFRQVLSPPTEVDPGHTCRPTVGVRDDVRRRDFAVAPPREG